MAGFCVIYYSLNILHNQNPMANQITQKSLLTLIYLGSLLYSFSYALPLYINSSFLHNFIDAEKAIGFIFTAGAILSIVGIIALPKTLKRFGNYRTTLTIIGLQILSFVALGTLNNPVLVVSVFILSQALLNIIYLNLNAFLEACSGDTNTGGTRGIFLTVINGAIIAAPFLGGLILTNGDFGKIYLAAAAFMAAVFFVLYRNFRSFTDPIYETFSLPDTFKIVWGNHNLHAIIVVQFLLNFFYAWMVIYTPLYLNQNMGIPMEDILTIIIPIALIPFVAFQVILGKIADNKLGEKEILVTSLFVMAASTGMLAFITTSSVFMWALILFATRVGASAVEIMSESYFYKQIEPSDVHIITFMYIMRTSAYIIGPLLGSLVLAFVDYRLLFLVLGAVMLAGIPFGLHFKDSR
jgi:MFS family permease